MLTYEQRKSLGQQPLPDYIGWDCEGELIKSGDKVKVIEKEEQRRDDPDYNYCSKGKQGKALSHFMGWMIRVEFKTKKGRKTAGCADINLKKI